MAPERGDGRLAAQRVVVAARHGHNASTSTVAHEGPASPKRPRRALHHRGVGVARQGAPQGGDEAVVAGWGRYGAHRAHGAPGHEARPSPHHRRGVRQRLHQAVDLEGAGPLQRAQGRGPHGRVVVARQRRCGAGVAPVPGEDGVTHGGA